MAFPKESDRFEKTEVMPLALDIRTFTIAPQSAPPQEPITKVEPLLSHAIPKPVKMVQKKVISSVPENIKKPDIVPTSVVTPLSKPLPEAVIKTQSEAIEVSKDAQKASVSDVIRLAIAHYKQYPKRAQREGLSGEVVIGFTWASLGISHLRIVKPSPHTLLNEYCLGLVQQASKDFPKVEEPIDIIIPIGFSLL